MDMYRWMTSTRWSRHLMLWYAIVLHAVIGAMVVVDPSAINITTLHEYAVLNIPRLVGAALIVGSVGALAALMVRGHLRWLLLLPQQVFLMVSAVGAGRAMVLSAFGDGVTRPRAFLIADQFPAVLAAGLHTVAVLRLIVEDTGHRARSAV